MAVAKINENSSAAAAAAAAGGGGKDFGSAAAREKTIKIFTKNLENEKIAKNIEKIDKNIDFGEARNKRTSPSNSTRKTTHIDLFSSLHD